MEGSLQAAKSRIDQWAIGDKFSSKAAYEYFRPQKIKLTWPKLLWHGCITPKHVFILWLGLNGRLLTRDKLQGLIEDQSCPLCRAADESVDHLFFQCNVDPVAVAVAVAVAVGEILLAAAVAAGSAGSSCFWAHVSESDVDLMLLLARWVMPAAVLAGEPHCRFVAGPCCPL
ncbi:hypothetical protein Acr_24g0007380 [Actinidia rufa]|uniref:Reverse transcriptase zinc-binding domain-containing protein n=1 Tax=Actinidia rufa TaxID=165716 RepID=A0A7J0GUU3_9ERIC|nr:hypothetical protein Acr_24g0007380 [Actinidia rufa]